MDDWQPIDTAPKDGTPVFAGKVARRGVISFPLKQRFVDGRWCAEFGPDDWRSIDPQPSHWTPISAHLPLAGRVR